MADIREWRLVRALLTAADLRSGMNISGVRSSAASE
jgi:hypothetical protein